MTATLDQLTTEPERDRWGRYLLPNGDGKKVAHTRVTTISSTLADKFNLQKWSERMVAVGLGLRPDLHALAASTKTDDKAALNRICDDAKDAAASRAGANLGTALHAFTERADRGEDVTAPPPWDADLAAYRQALVDVGAVVDPAWVERIVVLPEHRIAGTADRYVVTLPGRSLPIVADVKTGSWLGWDEIALQLALYANATRTFDPATGAWGDTPTVDRSEALIIHLPAGKATCTLHLVDIAAGWAAVQLALDVRAWRSRKDLARPLESTRQTAPPVVTDDVPAASEDTTGGAPAPAERRAWIEARVRAIADASAGGFTPIRWPLDMPTLKAHAGHTDTQLTVIATWCDQVEAELEIPFGEPDPRAALVREGLAERTTAVIDRLERLPGDLVVDVVADAKAQGVPNLRDGKATTDELDLVERLLTAPEQAHAQRNAHVRALLAHDQVDDELAAALARAASDGRRDDLDRLTLADVDRLAALVAALDTGVIDWHEQPDGGIALEVTVDTGDRLVAVCGSRAEVLRRGRVIAKALERSAPRSADDVAIDPVLAAVLAAGATSPDAA